MNRIDPRPFALVILDGWGVAPASEVNAITRAHTPYYDEICAAFPRSILAAAGESVGLSAGAPGNAEVGHLNLGAGRVVRTDVSRIEDDIRSGNFFNNSVLKTAYGYAATESKPVHLIGLISDGGVHSSPENLYALLRMAKREGVSDVFVHGILDGRDVAPRTADIYIDALEIKMADIGVGKVATLCGRFFAMDANEHWERTARAFTMLVHAEGERAADAVGAIRSSYLRGIADEFIAPIVLESEPDTPVATIRNGDVVVFFNHRADTMRQLVRAVAVPDAGSTVSSKSTFEAVCLTEYDRGFDLPVAFPPGSGGTTLTSIFAETGQPNYRIAETDRFPHVTRFLDGRADLSGQFQQNIHLQSAKSTARESEPEMGSFKLTDKILRAIESDPGGVFIINLSASDLVAETGDLGRTIEAVQFVDTCLGGIVEKLLEHDGVAVITSTHGNCEQVDTTGGRSINQVGTSNPVPFHLVGRSRDLRQSGSLRDVAPTILGLLGVEKPADMNGVDLHFV